MPRPYDDERYLEWYREFQSLVFEFLDTEGNDVDGLRAEVDLAIENAESE